MKELIKALQDYHTKVEGMARIPEFVARLKEVKNLSDYVNNLAQNQKEGRMPVLSIVRNDDPNPVRLDLYWEAQSKTLELDWDDADPYKVPYI